MHHSKKYEKEKEGYRDSYKQTAQVVEKLSINKQWEGVQRNEEGVHRTKMVRALLR